MGRRVVGGVVGFCRDCVMRGMGAGGWLRGGGGGAGRCRLRCRCLCRGGQGEHEDEGERGCSREQAHGNLQRCFRFPLS